MAIKNCPKCGGKVAGTRDTCIHCGYVFKDIKMCPECNENVKREDNYCPSCGYEFVSIKNNYGVSTTGDKIIEIKCPSCGGGDCKQVDEDDFECNQCNSKFKVNQSQPIINNNFTIIKNNDKKVASNSNPKYERICYIIGTILIGIGVLFGFDRWQYEALKHNILPYYMTLMMVLGYALLIVSIIFIVKFDAVKKGGHLIPIFLAGGFMVAGIYVIAIIQRFTDFNDYGVSAKYMFEHLFTEFKVYFVAVFGALMNAGVAYINNRSKK